jgi:hypothetical protein
MRRMGGKWGWEGGGVEVRRTETRQDGIEFAELDGLLEVPR